MILLLPRDLMLWCLVLAAALQMCPTCAEMSPGREDGGYYTTRTHEIYLFTIYTDIYYLSPLRTPCLCHVISTQGAAVWRGRAAALHTARLTGCRCITCTHLTPPKPSQPSPAQPAQPSPAQSSQPSTSPAQHQHQLGGITHFIHIKRSVVLSSDV